MVVHQILPQFDALGSGEWERDFDQLLIYAVPEQRLIVKLTQQLNLFQPSFHDSHSSLN